MIKTLKEILLSVFSLLTSIIMWIPITWIRRLYVKLFVGEMGRGVYIARNVDIRKPRNIIIGDNVIINKRVLLDGRGGVLKIGDNVDIAQDVNIWTLTHDPNDSNHAPIGKPVTIESHVWIGARSTIMPGVSIQQGAVIGTNAVVTKNVGPLDIVGGIPAKVIGRRNNQLQYEFKYNPWLI